MSFRFAVVGHPVAHSWSPQIHQAFAQQLGLSVTYDAIDIPESDFEPGIQALIEQGYEGFNVTLPHKEHAYVWVSEHSHRAQLAGAVNTLMPTGSGHWCGDNTDGVGLIHDLTRLQGLSLQGYRVLILGAGGAVRGILGPLLACQPQAIHVANRTPSKADMLARHFAVLATQQHTTLTASGFDQISEQYDLVINGTSASLHAELPPVSGAVFAPGATAYDMMYAAGRTTFNEWAAAQGVSRCIDGLGMLVGQAAESFTLWTGQRPDAAPVLRDMRKLLR